jgi:SET and MYND domain-containing protein
MTDFGAGTSIIYDETKGRCLVASRAYAPGEIVAIEQALVYASYRAREPHIVSEDMSARIARAYHGTNEKVLAQVPSIVKALVKLKKCQSRDTARCLLQLIALTAEAGNETDVEMRTKLEMLSQLSAANATDCNRDVRAFRKKHPKWLPRGLSDAHIASLLGILNTNQIELEDYGGSGLFVFTAIIEHNCRPNCSFTTSGNAIFVTATSPIQPGDRLSLDYTNNFYHPTAERIVALQKTYGFQCTCESCTGPDIRRSFNCLVCPDGLVCPSSYDPMTDQSSLPWVCLNCQQPVSPERCYQLVEYENRFIDSEFESLDQVFAVRAEGVMHPSHYALFWAIEGLASQYAETGLITQALSGMREAVAMLNNFLPGYHHEKVLYLDKLGQLAVSAGDIAFANEAFRQAYEMSVVACGSDVPLTMKLRALYENTPQNVEALKMHYPGGLTGGDADDDDSVEEPSGSYSRDDLEMDW